MKNGLANIIERNKIMSKENFMKLVTKNTTDPIKQTLTNIADRDLIRERQEIALDLMDAFEEKMMDVYANRDSYSRAKIIDLAKEGLEEVIKIIVLKKRKL